MSLELTLKNALSGLQTSQAALQTISNNIANANTEGYSRKQVAPRSLVIGGKGFGVEVGEVSRSVNEGILNLFRNETSETRKLEQQDSFLSQINKFFGRPEDNSSITHQIANFASQFDALAVSPEVEAAQFLAVNSGADVLRNLDSLSNEIQRLRNTANNDINTTVTEFNLLVETIAKINGQIVQFENSNLDGSELKDQRDRSLNSLAEIVDIKYFDTGTGAINVFAGKGQTVVNGGSALKISYASPSLIASRSEYTPKTATNYVGPGSSGHPVGGIPGIFVGEEAPNTDLTTGISSGRLKGLVDIRDFELPMLQSQLDELAEKLKVEVNAVHNKGAGSPAVFGFTGDRYVQAGTRFEGTGQVRIGIVDDDGTLREDKIVDLSLPEGFTTYESSIFANAATDAITTAGQLTFSNDAGAFALTVNYANTDSLNGLVSRINAVVSGPQNIVASVVATDGTGLNRLKITDTDGQTFNITETGGGSLLTDLTPKVRTVGDLVTGLSTMTNLTASVNTSGRLELNTSNNLRLAVNELTSSVSAAGDLNKGFSDFFGLNRLIDSAENFSRYRSDIFASSTTDAITTAGTLHFTGNDGTAWTKTIAYTASDTLTTLAAKINDTADATLSNESVTASIVADGATFRLEIADAEGDEFAIVETGGGTFLADTNIRTDTRGLSNRLKIREDIQQNNSFISRGSLQSNTFQSLAFNSKTTAFNATTPALAANGALQFTIDSSTTATVSYATTDTLQAVVSAINTNVTLIRANITAEAVIDETDDTKFKLKINDNNGDDFMIVDTGGLTVDVSQGVAVGDGSIAEELAEVFNKSVSFSEVPGQGTIGGLAASNSTFSDYSAKILSVASVRSLTIEQELNVQGNLQEELATKNASISGVNIDEELSNLIIFEQAFLAAARIITTTQELFKVLNDMV